MTLHEDVSEDFLTSSVFSTFDFLPNIWLKKFLQTSINLNNNRLDFPLVENKFLFWKQFSLPSDFGRGVEPDLIIFAGNTAFIIEAKFYSGKSGIGFIEEKVPPDQLKSQLIDQLAREYFLGRYILLDNEICVEEKLFNISNFFLILITKDSSIPTNEIQESIDSIGKIEATGIEMATNKIYWTNWQKIIPVLEEIIEKSSEESFERKISQQLFDFLDKRDLIPFTGFDFLNSCSLELTTTTNEPIFYHTQKRTYWSEELFKEPLHFKDPNIFYMSTIKQYWKDIAKLKCPENSSKIFYQIIGR
ncbi:MAG: hypothetical protein KKA79_00375 [Nanoarchaeota archaeon]|nr:hypothetical protein [Nanoarchaeota archaeon]